VRNKSNIKGWNLKKNTKFSIKIKIKKILNIAIIKYKGVLIYAKILVRQTYWFHFSLNFSSAIHLLGYLWPGCLTIHFYSEVFYIYIKGGWYIIYLFILEKRKEKILHVVCRIKINNVISVALTCNLQLNQCADQFNYETNILLICFFFNNCVVVFFPERMYRNGGDDQIKIECIVEG
jgi:hypothetical protein